MYRETNCKTVKIDPRKAAQFLDCNTILPAYRRLDAKHVAFLADKMLNGLFLTGHIALATNDESGLVLINGQHQLSAVVASGKSITALQVKYHCPDRSDIASLYRVFDTGRLRTLGEIARAEAVMQGFGWPSKVVNLMASALNIDPNGKLKMKHRTVLVDGLRDYLPQGNFVSSVITRGGKSESIRAKHLCRTPLVAAMIRSWTKSPQDAEKFWVQVRDGAMLGPTDPAYILRNFLQMTVMRRDKFSFNRPRASRAEFYAKCVSAWNAFRQGREMRQLQYHPNRPAPKVA